MFTISFHIRSVYYRTFATKAEADRYFLRLMSNCFVHTIMYFDDNGDMIEVA